MIKNEPETTVKITNWGSPLSIYERISSSSRLTDETLATDIANLDSMDQCKYRLN